MTRLTCRRQHLDRMLRQHAMLLNGNVLDIGGKKENKRGEFRPPLPQVISWQYLNIDASTNPDYCCSADAIPVGDGSFDTALLCEVIEHLEEPERVLRESCRVLKQNGRLIATIPFLFPIHSDPHDYQRWTDTKIEKVFTTAGFGEVQVEAMGGTGSVVHDLLLVTFNRLQGRIARGLSLHGLRLFSPVLRYLDTIGGGTDRRITSGYFVVARKCQG